MNTIPGVVKLWAALPATERGKMNAVSALPACVVPPTAVKLFARSAGPPAGAVTSISAGNAVVPDAKARTASGPTAIDTYFVAVKLAKLLASAAGSDDVPPFADA